MSFACVPKPMFKSRVCLGVLSRNSQRGRLSTGYFQLFCVGFNSMPNLIVISSIIFPCMYVGLTVRDECERLVKNQVSNVDQVDFVTVSREATHEKSHV